MLDLTFHFLDSEPSDFLKASECVSEFRKAIAPELSYLVHDNIDELTVKSYHTRYIRQIERYERFLFDREKAFFCSSRNDGAILTPEAKRLMEISFDYR
jgi:hypothetical protein